MESDPVVCAWLVFECAGSAGYFGDEEEGGAALCAGAAVYEGVAAVLTQGIFCSRCSLYGDLEGVWAAHASRYIRNWTTAASAWKLGWDLFKLNKAARERGTWILE